MNEHERLRAAIARGWALGPRDWARARDLGLLPNAMGATEPTAAQQDVARLQAQINRFLSPGIPVTGVLDARTAGAAMAVMLQRFTRAFIDDPANRATAALFVEANKNLAQPVPWVQARLAEITDTIRDFGDYTGRPPARSNAAASGRTVAIVALAAAAMFVLTRRGRR
jgi:hypothetical protein